MLTRALSYGVPIGAAMVCFPSTVYAAGNDRPCKQPEKPCRVYDEPKCAESQTCECPRDSALEKMVQKVREELEPLKDKIAPVTENARKEIANIYGTFKGNLCYLRKRAPEEMRIGTVVAGGLIGMLFGIRRGWTRRILYGGIGAGAGAYLAYPDETVYYVKNGIPIVQKYAMIAYNFVLGDNKSCKPECPRMCGPASTVKSEKAAHNIRCRGFQGPESPVTSNGGFFGGLFGGGATTMCPGCGKSTCTCNSCYRDELKAKSQLPPLIQKCDDIPGPNYRDRVPKSTCYECGKKQDSCEDPCAKKQDPCAKKQDPCAKKQDSCGCAKKEDPCAKKEDPCAKKQDTCGKQDACKETKKDDKCDESGKRKCPPMPTTDCSNCKPAWMSCPPKLSKMYPVPEGACIEPISVGGRSGTKTDNCGKCGEKKDSKDAAKPKLSPNCPMMRPKCPGTEPPKEEGGFFAKLASFFGKK